MSIVHVRPVTDSPFVVQVTDLANNAYLRGLPAPSFHSNTAGAQWALPVTDQEAVDVGLAGSAYLVSAEAFKRIKAGRLS